jgi:hypothetical protein
MARHIQSRIQDVSETSNERILLICPQTESNPKVFVLLWNVEKQKWRWQLTALKYYTRMAIWIADAE